MNFFFINNEEKVLGYSRTLNGTTIYIILNNNNDIRNIQVKIGTSIKNSILNDLIDNQNVNGENNIYKISLRPYQLMVLR